MHEPVVRDVIGEAISKSIQNLTRSLVTTVPSQGRVTAFFVLPAKIWGIRSVPWEKTFEEFRKAMQRTKPQHYF